MKTSNTIWLFVLIFLMVLGLFLFLNKSASQVPKNLEQTLACYDSPKLDQTILSLPENTVNFKAFISFEALPLSEGQISDLKALGVSLDQSSGVFEYLWAQIPTGSVCQLVERSDIRSIFTLK
ncbi:hypothetical protein KBC40_01435 [Patescibacteria group bacterium]|nr:hypothetical protein [Patescibacteria group bacterium]